ncbi:MAG: EAL domain-containing protein, partial [Ignavibacteriales bacterium]
PINSGKETIGVAHFSSLEKTSFTQQESDFILSLANQTGVAIAKAMMLKEMKQREEALRESEERFSLFMRNLPGVAFMKDVQGHHIYVNETWEKIFHKRLSGWFGKTDDEIWPYATATQFKENDRVTIESRKAFQTIETAQHEDGIHYWLSTKFPILDKNGNPVMVGGIAIDITERKVAEEALRQSEERYRTLFDQSSVGVYIFNQGLKIIQCNERMVQILQSSYDKIMGMDMRRLKDQSFIPAMENVFEGQFRHQESFYEATTSSAKLWLSISLSPLRDADGNVIGGMGIVEDITERKRQEERIHYLATHDYLTDLPNRRVLEENLKRAVDRSQRGHSGALLLIDLDNFKMVNDTLGHLGGDQLLTTLAQRLRRTLRPDDLLARFGGDEFALLVEWVSVEEVKAIAERIYGGVTESHFHLNNHSIDLTICIGIALIDGGLNDQAVLALADSALYAAKNFGKSRIVLYQGEDDKQFKLAEIGQWASRIKDALREEHFVLFFQPVIQLRSGEIGYFEALIRLRNESGEIILPGEFISAAERFGLMPQIDRWIIRSVLRILRTRPDLRIFINLSGQSLRDASLLEFTKTCIQESRVTPGQLSFEIIETVAATDLVRVQHWMKQLKELGCLFALDDFGIGFSTFSYLHALPVDYIKIDGSFIHNLDTDPANRAIVQAIATVANALNKEVIAEWVENKAVTETLRELGVKYGQGYMWGIPSAEIHGAS